MVLPAGYTHCCYTLMRQMTEGRPRSRTVVLLHYLDWAVYLYAVRFYYIAPLAYAGYPTLPAPLDWRQDPISLFFYRHRHIYDAFTPVIVLLLASFHTLMRQLMYRLKADTPTWRWWRQLVVLNQDLYRGSLLGRLELVAVRRRRESETLAALRKGRFGRLMPSLLLVPLARAYSRFQVFKDLDHVNKQQFFGAKLDVLPGLSEKMRKRMLFTTILADKVITGVQVLSSCIALTFILLNLPKFIEPYSAASRPYIVLMLGIELGILMHYYLFRLMQCALFFTACTIIATITYTGHARELYKMMRAILSRAKAKQQQVLPLQDLLGLTKVLVDHNKICYLVVAGSDELFGAVLFTFLITNVPINIYCIRNLVFLRLDPIIVATFYFMITVQFVALVTVFGPPAWCCAVYHAPKKWIFQLQIRLRGPPWCLLKLKYDDLLNRMLYGSKIAIYMGPNSPITYMSALEFILMYSSYTMMMFSSMIQQSISPANV